MTLFKLALQFIHRKRIRVLLCTVIIFVFVVYGKRFIKKACRASLPIKYQLSKSTNTDLVLSFNETKEHLCAIIMSPSLNRVFADTLARFTRVEERPWPLNTVHGCHAFKLPTGEEPGISQEELEYPLAFSFNIHTEFAQFARLLRAVYRKHNIYCIHVDGKSEKTFRQQVETLAQCFGSNIHIIPEEQSYSITWGDFGPIESWILCARHFLTQSTVRWKYMLNGSGQEFPLRTNWELVKALKAVNGSNIIEFDDYKFVTERAPKERPALNVSKLIRLQDELFFTTLSANAHFNAPGGCPNHRSNDSDPRALFIARYVEWYPKECERIQRFLCITGVKHIPKLISRPEFFVNKFIYDFQPLAYDCLEWWLLRKIKHEGESGQTVIDFDPSFYNRGPKSCKHFEDIGILSNLRVL
ncbi:unnamed protein product [Echinostoma caproni]|uniref:Beta-1,3-galactosyl-O-glycosyl-glycoprotein beta-1,6-N-acetylglucosaminyltransferase 3 n=1 Tax=Echinostoma caproni TaxID=27848 RepID=A0A183AI74_9TREM|nr:unnamed protein product [Echinostoma caproni]